VSRGSAHDAEFCEYVSARSTALLRTAYLLTGDPHTAEDLLQSALAKTYASWGRIHEKAALDAYVRRVMVNTRATWWRRNWRNERPTEQIPEPPGHDDDSAAAAERDHLWAHLAELPPRQRAVLVLRYYEDLPEAETAAIMGCSVGTVKSQARRALATLRTRLAREAAGDVLEGAV
jgi:RNA polymerase sigma-70 factor (sigma-E family)